MSRLFNIELTGTTSPGPYNIYYDLINPGNLTTLYPSNGEAKDIPLDIIITGITVYVPDTAEEIYVYNQYCDEFLVYQINDLDETYPCLCVTLLVSEDYDPDCYTGSSFDQLFFCYNGNTFNGKPLYENIDYNIVWMGNQWELSGYTRFPIEIISRNQTNVPNSLWEVYGMESKFFKVSVREDNCLIIDQVELEIKKQNPECIERNNGFISVVAYGGNNPWTYSIDSINYKDIGIFLNLGIGLYTIYARDDDGDIYTSDVTLTSDKYCTAIPNDPNIGFF